MYGFGHCLVSCNTLPNAVIAYFDCWECNSSTKKVYKPRNKTAIMGTIATYVSDEICWLH